MPAFEPIRITRLVENDVSAPRNDGTPGSAPHNVPFRLAARRAAAARTRLKQQADRQQVREAARQFKFG
jgi:hypothetical protein